MTENCPQIGLLNWLFRLLNEAFAILGARMIRGRTPLRDVFLPSDYLLEPPLSQKPLPRTLIPFAPHYKTPSLNPSENLPQTPSENPLLRTRLRIACVVIWPLKG